MVNEQILQIKDKNIFIKIKAKVFIFKCVSEILHTYTKHRL